MLLSHGRSIVAETVGDFYYQYIETPGRSLFVAATGFIIIQPVGDEYALVIGSSGK
jgi:hypothetical protein